MSEKLLIVDDDLVDRTAVRRALRHGALTLEIEEASSCAEAQTLIREGSYDCIVLDLFLPDGTGLSVLKRARAEGVRCPIIVLTGQGDEQTAVEIMKAGATDYLPKGLAAPDRLSRALQNALRVHRAEKQALDTEDRLRRQLDVTTAITGSLAEGVCAFDPRGHIMFANAAAERILGHSPSELLARELAQIVRSPASAREILATVFRGSVLRVDDDAFLRRDGSVVPVSYAASPILTDGEASGGVLAFHDATARKRAEAELEASRRQLAQTEKLSALGTLVSGVAHELRTPLTYLTNNLFLLQARLDAAAREDPRLAALVADSRRFSQAALDGADRINALVRDLRPFSSTESGQRLDARLHTIVAGAVDLFRATQRGRIEVVADLEATGVARVDRGQIQRVVINLLVNAAEAMPNGGTIRIWTRAREGHGVIEVEDEGPGIPSEVQVRIFDPFFTTKPDGTGLGLAITRRIVESHGGEISFLTHPGRGTRFTVMLPRADDEPALTDADGQAPAAGRASPPAPAAPAPPAPHA